MTRPVFARGFLGSGWSVCQNVSGLLMELFKFLATMGIRARLASQMVRSVTTAFFDQAWDVWVDRTAILVKSPAEPGGIK